MIAELIGLLTIVGTLAAAAYGVHQGRLARARTRLPDALAGFEVRSTKDTDGGVARIFEGSYQGRPTHLRCWQPAKGERTWRMQMGLERDLPDGVSLGKGLTLAPWGLTSLQLRVDDGPWGRFVCTGDNPRRLLSALLADPPAEAIPTGRESFVVAAYLDGGMLTVGVHGASQEQVLGWLTDLYAVLRALERAVEQPFRQTVERTGLSLVLEATGWPRLEGTVEGVNVSAYVDDALDTRIEATFDNGDLPDDLVVMHKDRLVANMDLDDPVLSMLVAARCSRPEALNAQLTRPGVAEAMCAVVHAFPGSRVMGDRVELRAPRILADELAPTVEAVIALAAGLKA